MEKIKAFVAGLFDGVWTPREIIFLIAIAGLLLSAATGSR